MTSTYEMIKALPGKGTDWRTLVDALRDHYFALQFMGKLLGKVA